MFSQKERRPSEIFELTRRLSILLDLFHLQVTTARFSFHFLLVKHCNWSACRRLYHDASFVQESTALSGLFYFLMVPASKIKSN